MLTVQFTPLPSPNYVSLLCHIVIVAVLCLPGFSLAATEDLDERLKNRADDNISNFKTYYLTAPPRGDERNTYQPVVDYLSKETGVTWKYRPSTGYLSYQKDILNDHSDLYFDGAHFSAWRIRNNGHRVLAKIPQPMIFEVLVKKKSKFENITDESQFSKVFQGKQVCLLDPPNFATLTFLSHFKNPLRQPILIHQEAPKNLFSGLVSEQCSATVMPSIILDKYDINRSQVKVIHRHEAYPNLSFTISPKVPDSIADRVQKALLSSNSKSSLKALFKSYGKGSALIKPKRGEYTKIPQVLSNAYGFGFNF